MRQIIICTMLFLVSSSSFSQQTTSQPSFTQQNYLEKSKKQKKVGTVLLVVGAGLIATAIIIPRGELVYNGISVGPYSDNKYKNDGIKSAFFIAGGLSALGSIPFFILSKKNRRKATIVSFKIEPTTHLYKQNLVYTSFPALRVKVNL